MKSYLARYRKLSVHGPSAPKSSRVVVLSSAFVENHYWYQIEVEGYSLAKELESTGYDTQVLNFAPRERSFRRAKVQDDASFIDSVCRLLPKFFDHLTERYQEIHFIGHSYGVTQLLAFFAGCRLNQVRGKRVVFDPELAKLRQTPLSSFVSLGGLFKLDWSKTSLAKLSQKTGESLWLLQTMHHLAPLLPTRFIQRLSPILSMAGFRSLATPGGTMLLRLASRLMSPLGLNPVYQATQVNYQALCKALAYGSNDETMESVRTILGLFNRLEHQPPLGSPALNQFTDALSHIEVPIRLVQGSIDKITPCHINHKWGYERVSSPQKSFVELEGVGHQDMLVGQKAESVHQQTIDWIKKHSKRP